ncbi:lipopolysaccharide heptosyltransferase RfaC [secondary endosymbiont of Ctenarytaina eucalypti]|uniref:Lipopolysaccharide heptosyltransferase 1 n=1 Tax=secondary endosymbiont of Ctenarytaina eucalypti TaxID=1199245 RepID=J3TFQ2_9ENTR|nr:lipopolysaccharide heptosyltransferase RfaC [secondary endosymbiont of Ctenarytaina eucalypti]AFP85112.1 lipopolysaccharide heptosyltransferase I [secondary endosymbiont of Ctenarytaina eucalypti]
MQVLIVKTSSMGDLLHTLPSLTDAKRAFPEIFFDWVVEENFVQIPTLHPAVRRVLPVAIRRWRKNWFTTATLKERDDFKRQLQKERYDAVIDAQGLIKSSILVTRYACGEKHGLDYKSAREPFASWFYDQRHYVDNQQHAIERIRQLFAASLGYRRPMTFGEYSISPCCMPVTHRKPYLVFLHATTRPEKQWPETHWRALIQFSANHDYSIELPWGTHEEKLRAQRLANGFSAAKVLMPSSLAQLATVISGASALVSVDTGLSHLAAALNRPNLTLYGPTNPSLIGAYGRHQQALCATNGNMTSLTAEYVWKTFKPMLSLREEE